MQNGGFNYLSVFLHDMANANNEAIKQALINEGISHEDADALITLAEELDNYEPIADLIGEIPRDV